MLVAISIPIFTNQLEKSREATDAANIRAAYSEIVAAYLTADSPAAISSGYVVELKQTVDDWATGVELPEGLTVSGGGPKAGGTASLSCDVDGKVTVTYTTP